MRFSIIMSPMRSSWWLVVVGGSMVVPAAASADVVLVVVESVDPDAADAIRDAVTRRLAVQAVGLGDAAAQGARRSLAVTYDPGRLAHVLYRTSDGSAYREEVRAEAGRSVTPERVGEVAATLVQRARHSLQIQSEVLDPFADEPQLEIPEVITAGVTQEVLDPWGNGGAPSTPLLAPTPPSIITSLGAAVRATPPLPSSVEPASGLTAPTPGL